MVVTIVTARRSAGWLEAREVQRRLQLVVVGGKGFNDEDISPIYFCSPFSDTEFRYNFRCWLPFHVLISVERFFIHERLGENHHATAWQDFRNSSRSVPTFA